jgi:beta-xylosidase
LQWQWFANPQPEWYSLTANPNHLRLYTIQNLSQSGNFWFVPNLLLQKFPAPEFTATTKIIFHPDQIDDKSGLVVMGKEWAFIAMIKTDRGLELSMCKGLYNRGYDDTQVIESIIMRENNCILRVFVDEQAICHFSYSFDGNIFQSIGKPFQAVPGIWIGAKVGLFSINPNMTISKGYADFEWFRVE